MISLWIILCLCLSQVSPSVSQAVWGENVTVREGGEAEIRCHFSAYDGSIVVVQNPGRQTLIFNGTQALKDDRLRLVSFTPQGISVSLSPVSVRDEGDYYCQLYTEVTQHQISRLTVLVPPGLPVVQVLGSPPVAGETVELLCSVSRSKPTAQLHWYRRNQQLTGNVSQEVREGVTSVWSQVRFPVTVRDNGETISCHTETPGVTDTHRVSHLTLNVLYSPRVSVLTQGTVHREGNRLVLNCQISANPPAEGLRWSRLNLSLPGGSVSQGLSLTVPVLTVSDAGTYVCETQNTQGQGSGEYKLRVYERDAVVASPPPPPPAMSVFGGVIGILVFGIVCGFTLIVWFSVRHKGSYLTHEATGLDEHGEAREAFINGTEGHEKEYFI